MRHAGPDALAQLAPLLVKIRMQADGLVERTPGMFYRKGQEFLHFHEDAAGLFADLKIGGAWQRFAVGSQADRATFLAALRRTSSAH